MSVNLKEVTQAVADLYFKGCEGERPYDLWRSFDKNLAQTFSVFVAGQLYSRERIPHATRQFAAVAALTVLERREELRMHIHAAINVGCAPEQIAEVMFQMIPYGGFPVVNTGLKVLRDVLKERGLWPMSCENVP